MPKELVKRMVKRGIVQHGPGQLRRRLPHQFCQRFRRNKHHTPASCVLLNRYTVMNLARVGGNHLPRQRLNLPTPAGRDLPAFIHQTKSVRVMPMLVERAVAAHLYSVHTAYWAATYIAGMNLTHSKTALSLRVKQA